MVEVCRAEFPKDVTPYLGAAEIHDQVIAGILRPRDLTDIYMELQVTAVVALESGLGFSLGWNGMGPVLGTFELTREKTDAYQSFWDEFALPVIPDWPDIRKVACADLD